jgi:hypothetical protein
MRIRFAEMRPSQGFLGEEFGKASASRSIAATEGEYPSRSVVISLEI